MSAAPKLPHPALEQLAADVAELRALADRIAARYGLEVEPARRPEQPSQRRRRTRIAPALDVTDEELVDVAAAARGLGYRVKGDR